MSLLPANFYEQLIGVALIEMIRTDGLTKRLIDRWV